MKHDFERPGQEIDLGFAYRFRIGQEIGRSSYGIVWQAIWLQNNKAVAIKSVPRQSMVGIAQDIGSLWTEALKREVSHLKHLHDRHIVRYLHSGVFEGMPILVLEQLHETLPNYLHKIHTNVKKPHRLPLAEALKWIRQVAHGLATVHRTGLQHLDIKPSNLLLTAPSPLGHRLKIADFGTCQKDNGQPHIFMGTPGWLAPEQAMACGTNDGGSYVYCTDARSDVYALGLLFFHLVTGERTEFSRYNQLAMSSEGESFLQHDCQFNGALSAKDVARFSKPDCKIISSEPLAVLETALLDQHTWRPQFTEHDVVERDAAIKRQTSNAVRSWQFSNLESQTGLKLLETFCAVKPENRPSNGHAALDLINEMMIELKIA